MMASNRKSYTTHKNAITFIAMIVSLMMQYNLIGQKMSIAKDSFLIGEPITMTIMPSTASGDALSAAIDFSKIKNLLYPRDTTTFEQYADINLDSISKGDAQVIEKSVVFKSINTPVTIHFTVFSLGIFSINNGSDSILIRVVPPAGLNMQNLEEIKDIKPIIEETGFDYMTWLYALAGILVFAALAYWLYKRFKNKNAKTSFAQAEAKTYVSPYDEAMSALHNLIATKQYESADVKYFQTILTDILRQYTSRQYDIKSFEMTSYEIIDALQAKDRTFQHTQILNEVFSLSDQVKFAKARPGHELCKEAVEKSIHFVENSNR
jgi:LPXTG-motif cell wall-anchored protein